MFNELNNNVDKLIDNIQKINGNTFEIPTLDTKKITFNVLTSEGMSDEVAYKIIYGKLQYNAEGKLDHVNGIVDKEKSKLNKSTKEFIEKKVKETKMSLNVIKQKSVDIAKASTQLGVEIGAASVTVASSAVIMPIGSGLPVAFSAVQGVFSSLQSFKTLLTQLLPFFSSLSFLKFIIPEDKVESIVNPINIALLSINTVLGTVTSIISIITSFQKKLQNPPGVNGEPTEPIEIDIYNDRDQIHQNEEVNLNAKPRKGSWKDYKFKWSSNVNPSFSSTKSSVTDKPLITTIYTVKVTDSIGNSTTKDIEIKVI